VVHIEVKVGIIALELQISLELDDNLQVKLYLLLNVKEKYF
jgi:hypothetical protein